MGWESIVGHAETLKYLHAVIASGRIASAFLFCGPEGIGKRTVARLFAQTLLCEGAERPSRAPCGGCPACQQVVANSHPDLISVSRPPDKAFIPIEAFIGSDGKMREGLCHDLSLKPFRGGRKIAIVDDADFINQEGANSLLKTLEEPPPGSVLILIGTSPARQLPTIRSRCQRVLFQPLTVSQVADVLQKTGLADDAATALRLATASAGSVQQALALRDPAILEFRANWLRQLATGDPGADMFAKATGAFIDQAGNDTAAKRDRMRSIVGWAIEFYEQSLHAAGGQAEALDDAMMRDAIAQFLACQQVDSPRLARCLERCLDAHSDVALNVNQALWIDCLLADLSKLVAGDFADVRYV